MIHRSNSTRGLIVVLSGEFDIRAKHRLLLIRDGYAQQFVLDPPNRMRSGRNQAEAAEDYLRSTMPDQIPGKLTQIRLSLRTRTDNQPIESMRDLP